MAEPWIAGPYLVVHDYVEDGWQKWGDWTPLRNPTPGPFEYNGALYYFCVDYGSYSGSPPKMIKSSDGGETWVDLPTVFPDYTGSGDPAQWFWYPYRAGGTSNIRILTPQDDVYILNFDMASDTLSVVASLDDWDTEHGVFDAHYNHVTGTDCIFWSAWPYPYQTHQIYMTRYNGTWQPAVPIVSVSTPSHWPVDDSIQAATDSSGNIHAIVALNDVGNGGSWTKRIYYFRLSPSGSVLGQEIIYSYPDVDAVYIDVINTPMIAIIGDSIVVTTHYPAPSYVFVGTPLSAPSWSRVRVASSDYSYEARVSTDAADNLPASTGRLWWVEQSWWDPTFRLFKSRTFDGETFGDEEVVHDEFNYPSLGTPPESQTITYVKPPIRLSSGDYGWCMGLYDPDGYLTDYYFSWIRGTEPEEVDLEADVDVSGDITIAVAEQAQLLTPLDCFHVMVAHPADSPRIMMDWSGFFGGEDCIESCSWSGTTGLVITDAVHDAYRASVQVAMPGSSNGESYLLRCEIHSQTGLVETRSVMIHIATASTAGVTATGTWRA